MKFAVPTLVALSLALLPGREARASEGAESSEAAVLTLMAGFEAHPDQAAVLFQDSLQTNPEARQELFQVALRALDPDAALLTRLIYTARTEFPDDDALFAQTAMELAPQKSSLIRRAFSATPAQMEDGLAHPETLDLATAEGTRPADAQRLDQEIREAMARAAAKVEGRAWPEQKVPEGPRYYKKSDEIRVARHQRPTDESTLYNHLPIDREDERAVAPGPVSIDDLWEPSDALRLDESKFAKTAPDGATRAPLDATVRHMSPAGAVGLPKRPQLRSSLYYIPPADGRYESTIDLESGEAAPPPLIIQPQSLSPSRPKRS